MPETRAHASARVDVALWIATGICASLTLWLSLWMVPPGTSSLAFIDKVQHFLAYLVTSGTFYAAAIWRPHRGPGSFARHELPIAIGLVVAAGAIELLQGRLGRDAELLDWFAGCLGVVASFGVGAVARRRSARTVG